MPLQMLKLGKEADEAPPRKEPALHVLAVQSTTDKILVRASGSGSVGGKQEPFEIVANMNERAKGGNKQCLKYVLSLETHSSSHRLEMRGEATVTYSRSDYDLGAEDSDRILRNITARIYEDNYQLIFLLSIAIGISPPHPGMLENVEMSS